MFSTFPTCLAARYLHAVCCHSKITANVSLANHVPLVKKSLETFVYRAKAMLAANDCSEAFELGTLKNRWAVGWGRSDSP